MKNAKWTEMEKKIRKSSFHVTKSTMFYKRVLFSFQILYQIHAQQEMDVLLGDFIASHSEYIIKSKRKTWKQKTAPITLYVNIF